MSENGPYNIGFDSKSGADDIYFAAKKPTETAGILLNKAESFFNTLRSNSYLDKIVKNWQAYHGIYSDGFDNDHQIRFTGEQGELIQFPVNHFRNIARHIYTMVTATRPIMEARAVNTDYKSLAQTYLANGILDYYMREKHLEEHIKRACEMAIVLGSGFIKMDWNATAGELYDFDPETGEAANEGELEFTNLSPFDVIIDGTKESWNHDWMMVRTFKNRYDLMAKYPELASKIRGIPSKNSTTVYRLAIFSNDETDDIPVYEFYHKKTESMPEGRYMLFVDSDVVLLDAKIPYRTIPVFRISPSDLMGTPYGYTDMFDAFPLQEVINSLYSTIVTNQSAFGVQNVFVPRGADISLNQLGEGMNIIEGNAKPESMNLTETPAEVFKFLETVVQSLETISGVNSVARGNPEASLKSGTALALVQSMALQFMSGLQQSYVKLIEESGTSLINILKDFSTTPKIVALVGKNNRSYLKEFTGDQIKDINRVIVDMGNPLSRTIAGRVQMAEQMLQMKVLKSPEQYLQVINTGRLDSTYEGEMNELMLIKSENERMLDGENPLVSPLDQHRLHINEHKAVLADPDLRKEPNLVKGVLDHIQGHLDALRNTDPDLLALVGEQALAPAGGVPPQGTPGQPMPNQESLEGSPIPDMMSPQEGLVVPGENIKGPGVENVPNPGLPGVDPSVLSNPQMQEQLGNIKPQ